MDSSSSDQQNSFVSIFLFPNGKPSCPEKLRLKRSEICTFFNKTKKGYCHHGKSLYTMGGDLVTGFGVINESAGFVMVVPHDCFIPGNYKQAFCAVSKKKKSSLKSCSRSAPSIPSSHCATSEDDKCRKKPKEHAHFVSKDKYPCCDQTSDSSEFFIPKPQSGQSPCSKKPASKPKPQKKGFLASCCPCFVKKPKAKPAVTTPDCPSRPISRARRNVKMTQTNPEDFKLAKKCLQEAIKEEKRRQKIYGKEKKSDPRPAKEKEALRQCNKFKDPKDKKKNEDAYRKARKEYCEKRKRMEQRINKELERELKKKEKC